MTGWNGTPGRWVADGFSIVDENRWTVAMVWPDLRVPSDASVARMNANAAGIAAMPKLVEALLSAPIIGGTESAAEFRVRQDTWLVHTYNPTLHAAGVLS